MMKVLQIIAAAPGWRVGSARVACWALCEADRSRHSITVDQGQHVLPMIADTEKGGLLLVTDDYVYEPADPE